MKGFESIKVSRPYNFAVKVESTASHYVWPLARLAETKRANKAYDPELSKG